MVKAEATGSGIAKLYNPHSFLRNVLVVAISVLGMGGSLLLFRQDLNRSMRQMEEMPAATVNWVSKTAQRVSVHYARRDRLERGLPVFYGDIINTAALSSAKMSFSGGETLELAENTSIRILYREKEPSFDLIEGEIQIQSENSGVSVSARSANFSLEPDTIAIIAAGDSYSLKVFQGSGELSSGGESRRTGAGKSLLAGNDGLFAPDPPVMMLSPRNGARILRSSHGKLPVQFLWRRADPLAAGAILLEIADTSDFSNLAFSLYSERGEQAQIELPEGTFFWRVYYPPANEAVDQGRFEVAYAPPPRALSPANNSVQSFRARRAGSNAQGTGTAGTATPGTGNRELRFSWSVPEDAESVLLEVASNPEMNRPRIRQLIHLPKGGEGSYVSSGLEPGQWYWRVHPVYPGGAAGGNAISSLGSGQSFWRLRPVSADIIADDLPSPINAFTLSGAAAEKPAHDYLPAPDAEPGSRPRIIYPADNFSVEAGRTPDIFFTWRNPSLFEPKLQIAERSDFSGGLIVDKKAYGSNFQSPYLPPGTYYWRIKGAGPGGPAETNPMRLVIAPSLAAPSLDSPRENERIIIEDGKAVSFTWERMNYANNYEFRLFMEGRETPLSEISSLSNNSVLVFFDPDTSGRFAWTVQGFASPTGNSTGRAGIIARGLFTVSPQRNLALGGGISWTVPRIANVQTYSGSVHSPISLLYPPRGANVPGIQALRAPSAARWQSEVPLRNVQFIISAASDPLSDPRAIVMDVSSSSVNFPSLSEGIWYWIIRGDTNDERGVSPGDPFWINVLPIPILPPPQLVQPENQAIIGIAQLTRDRNISFDWEEVEGANSYIFSIFRDDDPPVLLFTSTPLSESAYVFDSLSILNAGDYLWQAEAVYVNNGTIEQRGKIEQNSFTIEIQRSGGMQTQGQGTMYGQ